MTRLAKLFLVTTIMAVTASIVLGVALIHEAEQCGERGQALYKIGLRDGELFTRNQITRAEIEAEIIEEQQAKLPKERL